MLEPSPPLRKGRPMKGFPKKLKIQDQVWEVKWASNLKDDRGALGATLPDQRLIILDSTQSRESATDCLIHESLHAIFSSGTTWNLPEQHEEQLVRHLTPNLLSFLRSNSKWW